MKFLLQASTTRFSGVQGSCGGCDINLVGPLSDWVAAATPDSMQVLAFLCVVKYFFFGPIRKKV
jgi:hypothetical protein